MKVIMSFGMQISFNYYAILILFSLFSITFKRKQIFVLKFFKISK